MENNAEIINKFYTSFQKLDYKTVQSLYHDDATFSDPVFGALNVKQTRAMWEMLFKSAKNFSLEFSDVAVQGNEGTCRVTATYTYSLTGRRVVNHIYPHFLFKEGKIYKQKDVFDLWKWAGQALGPVGSLLGWLPAFQNKIRYTAKEKLDKYMASR